ncbi:glycosyltransferase [Hydrogenimonas cancrithermarum]|uniref:Glycosyl transferase n=1 Tax=Hydrogenimonas cancrithermarum TaxID=2993563 RepID=A0ABN6WVR4_9BACT|nr:glycosyltransferase [Hydrogenimonas cancrithermarum]BDY13174.1 glycosyl transferase [Hydrogenimonas cancrithermarum]
MDRIAVIMSVYRGDEEDKLREALKSLYAQKTAADIFVQLDGPVSSEVAELLQKERREGRIAYLGERKENRGLAASLDELLDEVLGRKYEYIARMDADDISLPERFEKQHAFMEAHPDVDVVGGFIEEFADDGGYRKIVRYPLEHEEMFDFFKKRVPLAHVTAFFRRTFFEKAGLYPTESPTNEDTLMWMKGFQNGCRFANISEVVVKVRVSPEFFGRRGGIEKAWSDFRDRVRVIRTLGYNFDAYFYAVALFFVNVSPGAVKKYLYKRLR